MWSKKSLSVVASNAGSLTGKALTLLTMILMVLGCGGGSGVVEYREGGEALDVMV